MITFTNHASGHCRFVAPSGRSYDLGPGETVNIPQPGDAVPVVAPIPTPQRSNIGPNTTGSIPIGARQWAFKLISGTGTFGDTAIEAGFVDSDIHMLLTSISYSTGPASSAFVHYVL